MKRRISALVVLLLTLTLVCGSISTVSAATKPTKMTFSASSTSMFVGTTVQLKVKTVKPAKASKAVTYKTSNKNIATVNNKGVVTAKKVGTVKITVTSKSNNKLKKTFTINVKNPAKAKIDEIHGVTFNKDFEITKDHDMGFLFVKDGAVKSHFFNKTEHTMIVFDNMKFGTNAVCRIENTLQLGKDDVPMMPKFSGGTNFECEGCGSFTAFGDTSLNGTPYACDISSVTSGKFYEMTNHTEVNKPDKVDAIEIVQYYEGGSYKVMINGLVY